MPAGAHPIELQPDDSRQDLRRLAADERTAVVHQHREREAPLLLVVAFALSEEWRERPSREPE
ncbi:MAG TPA: hypothetical protein VGQ67_09260 [Candidatus Polarisedimenticolia bacterium]|jgi:hypothetical protein|nr:hypothetical protein [Candidatus Polarisedimenticolia bacterium]